MKYIDIQKDIVKKYRIKLDPYSKCWSRTHAHVKQRRICKWNFSNSVQATFTLLHEVGHIENNHGNMRRCEEEYFATVWALEKAKEYGLVIPDKIIDEYQKYIDSERERGIRRGGKDYGDLKLIWEVE